MRNQLKDNGWPINQIIKCNCGNTATSLYSHRVHLQVNPLCVKDNATPTDIELLNTLSKTSVYLKLLYESAPGVYDTAIFQTKSYVHPVSIDNLTYPLILINRLGGYLARSERKEVIPIKLVKGFESNDSNPTISGWLSPTNNFLQCAYSYHNYLAKLLGYTENELEQFGWLKISNNKIVITDKTTSAQIIYAKSLVKGR